MKYVQNQYILKRYVDQYKNIFIAGSFNMAIDNTYLDNVMQPLDVTFLFDISNYCYIIQHR